MVHQREVFGPVATLLPYDGSAAAAAEIVGLGGGTLVTLGSAGVIATDSGILRGINKRASGSMNTPGSIMTVKVTDNSSPLVYGYDEISHVFRGNSPIFSVPDYDREYSPLQFGVKEYDDGSDDESDSDAVEIGEMI